MKKIDRYYWFVIIAGILSGTIVLIGKIFSNLGMSLYEISTLPFILPTIFLLPFILLNKKYGFKKETIPVLVLYGIVAGAISLAQFGSVIMGVPVAIVVLLLYTQPLWTIIFSNYFLKEKITFKDILACLIVLLGLAILLNPFGAGEIKNWTGIIVALIGGISLSGWLVIGSFVSKKGNEPLNTLFSGNIFMLLSLAILYPFVSQLTKIPQFINFSFNWSFSFWLYLSIFGFLISIIIPLFYLNGVKKISTTDAGIILLLEPLVAAILSAILLNQQITFNILIGGIFIFFANYLKINQNKEVETQIIR